ncbi:MAG: iron-sulfur cluster insertion protein ErpA [Micavibrio sp.]|nr:iron-sulfur cluster insertion protein ErpA [Micavibrio sp.]
MNANMSMTESAAKRILTLREKDNNPKLMLRVTVLGGGCSGFQYELDFTDTLDAEDLTFEKNGAVMVTDTTSIQFLQNAEIDYVSDMLKSQFKIRNPNEAAGCGCGKSFSPKMA